MSHLFTLRNVYAERELCINNVYVTFTDECGGYPLKNIFTPNAFSAQSILAAMPPYFYINIL